MFKKFNYFISIILFSLLLGFLYYYFLRESIIGLSWIGVESLAILDFKFATYILWFPTFIHPFIFSLLSWWAMGFKYPKSATSFWFMINLFAEFGQGLEKNYLDEFPLLLRNYFRNGTFDWVDIVSIFLGASFAYVVMKKFKKEKCEF